MNESIEKQSYYIYNKNKILCEITNEKGCFSLNKVIIAIGNEEAEKYLKGLIETEPDFKVVAVCLYKSAILNSINTYNPDIIVMTEGLYGNEIIWDVVRDIRTNHPGIRIVFIAGNRKAGCDELEWLVNKGIYDICFGASVNLGDAARLVHNPNTLKDVMYLQKDYTKNQQTEIVPIMTRTPERKSILEGNSKELVSPVPQIPQKAPVMINHTTIEEPPKPAVTGLKPPAKSMGGQMGNMEFKENHEDNTTLLDQNLLMQGFMENDTPVNVFRNEDISKNLTGNINNVNFNNNKSFINNGNINNNYQPAPVPQKKRKKKEDNSYVYKTISVCGGFDGIGTSSIALNIANEFALSEENTVLVTLDRKNKIYRKLGVLNDGPGLDGYINSLKAGVLSSECFATTYTNRNITPCLSIIGMSDKISVTDNSLFNKKNINMFITSLHQKGFRNIIFYIPYEVSTVDFLDVFGACNYHIFCTDQTNVSINNIDGMVNNIRSCGFNLKGNTTYVINKYEKCSPKDYEIQSMLHADSVMSIRMDNKGFIKASNSGNPYSSVIKGKASKDFSNLIEVIKRGDFFGNNGR